MAWNYWYAYQCADSSETRGRRPSHEGGCGYWNVRGTRCPIYSDSTVQGSPCKNCGRRQRLNPGIVHMESPGIHEGRILPDGTTVNNYTSASRKAWAVEMAERENQQRHHNLTSPNRAWWRAWMAIPEDERPSRADFMREWHTRSNASEQGGEEE